MIVTGTVQSGVGDASFRISQHRNVYEQWTGLKLFAGSLNILLPAKFDWHAPGVLAYKKTHSLVPYGGNREICLIPCEIYANDLDRVYGFAWATTNAADEPDYSVLEIVSDVKLREALRLTDGSATSVEIPVRWR